MANAESWRPAAPASPCGHLLFLCTRDGLCLQGSWHRHRRNQTSWCCARPGMGATEWKQVCSPAHSMLAMDGGAILNKLIIRCSNLFINSVYYTSWEHCWYMIVRWYSFRSAMLVGGQSSPRPKFRSYTSPNSDRSGAHCSFSIQSFRACYHFFIPRDKRNKVVTRKIHL